MKANTKASPLLTSVNKLMLSEPTKLNLKFIHLTLILLQKNSLKKTRNKYGIISLWQKENENLLAALDAKKLP